jgi:hypothetical protein
MQVKRRVSAGGSGVSGASESGLVYEVRGESALQMHLAVESAYGLTSFAGREAEIAYQSLRRRSKQACH